MELVVFIETVTATAREMVTRYGFSSLGPLVWEENQAEVFIGRDWLQQRPTCSNSPMRTPSGADFLIRNQAVPDSTFPMGALSP